MKKKRKLSKLNTYSIIISVVLAILTILNIYSVIKINVFPMKFLILFFILFLISGVIIFFNFKLKKKRKKARITLCVFSTIFSVIFLVMFIYLNKTSGFLNTITSKNYKTENYIVVVNKDSNYEKIEDIKDKNISYVKTDMYNTDEALKKLEEKIQFKTKVEDDYEVMLNNLYDNKTDAIIIESSYKDLLIESSNEEGSESIYKTFNDKTKIIYTFEIKLEVEEEEIGEEVNVLEQPFNIYISGIDTYGKISSISRSDVNIVATVNPKTKQVLLTTIPRDYYVQLNGTTGYKDKLTHAGIYGVDKSLKTIEDLLDIKINYYVKVNFTSLIKIVDAVGGINVYSEYAFSGENYSFKKGYNKVNGEQALEFARTRKTLAGGDRARGKNQEAVIAALIDKVCSKAIITNYISILDSLENTFVTNMEQDKITGLIKMQLDDMAKWNVTSIALDGTNGSEYTYSYRNQKLYVMIPTESTIKNAQEKISSVFNGEKLDSSYTESNTTNSVTKKTSTSTNSSTSTSTSKSTTSSSSSSTTTEKTSDSLNTATKDSGTSANSNTDSTNSSSTTLSDDNKEEKVDEVEEKKDSNEEIDSSNSTDTSSCTMVDGECMGRS